MHELLRRRPVEEYAVRLDAMVAEEGRGTGCGGSSCSRRPALSVSAYAGGTVKLSSLGRPRARLPRSSSCGSNPANVSRYRKQTPSRSSILTGGDVVATEMKEVVDLVAGGEEALRLAG